MNQTKRKIHLTLLLSLAVSLTSLGQVAREIEAIGRNNDDISKYAEIYSEGFNRVKSDPSLLKRGVAHYYQGAYLNAIQFPVGGIGGGSIQFDGTASPRYWQIFNNMTHDHIPNSFMAIRVESEGDVQVKALQTKDIETLKGMDSLRCKNEFPFLTYEFQDNLPVDVTMKVYNPFIPLNVDDSSIPAAFYQIVVTNKQPHSVNISLMGSQQNAVGFNRVEKISRGDSFADRYRFCMERQDSIVSGNNSPLYGGNTNSTLNLENAKVLLMEGAEDPNDEFYGQMALMLIDTPKNVKQSTGVVTSWENIDELMSEFTKEGILTCEQATSPSKKGSTYSGAVTTSAKLKSGESRTFTFAVVWYFPNGKNGGHMDGWDGWGKGKWQGVGNYYASIWNNIESVVDYIAQNHERVYTQSLAFNKSLYASNIPYWSIERLASQLSILKSRTIFHDKSGYVGLWEGVGAGDGSCAGNCNHVWHYAQAHARLFPELARKTRESSYKYIKDDGQIPYRHPAGSEAFDGQCGDIISTYREHLITQDNEWLKTQYPAMKRAMEYTISKWDSDLDGWLQGNMHTTYDCSMNGNPSFLLSLYAAALKTSAIMATICNDESSANRWDDLADKSLKLQNERLWNGEYYFQIDDPALSADNYNNGCHVDQLLGQWWSDQTGLGNLYPTHRIHSAFNSILKYNYRSTMQYHNQTPRKMIIDEEPGLLITTWPNNDRPKRFPAYSDESWTAMEYQLVASLIRMGQIEDAFALLKASVERYDGELKSGFTAAWGNFGFTGNPFGDDECGQFYGRSLSNWSILLALQGYEYDGPKSAISFSPNWQPHNHNSFYSTADGWGNFTQELENNIQTNSISVEYGSVKIKSLKLDNLYTSIKPQSIEVKINGDDMSFKTVSAIDTIELEFEEQTIELGSNLTIIIKH